MTFWTVASPMKEATRALARTSERISPSLVPEAISMRSRTLPLTCTTSVKISSFVISSSYCGQSVLWMLPSWPVCCHSSSVMCGASGASSCIIVSSVRWKAALRATSSPCSLISALLHSISAARAVLKRILMHCSVTRLRQKNITRVTQEISKIRFNTALAALMECNNALIKLQGEEVARSAAFQRTLETMMQLLAPLAPHITEELWQQTGHDGSIHNTDWPQYDEEMTKDEIFTLVVQVNGKVRERIEIASDTSEGEIRSLVLANARVASFIGDATIQKVIYVPGKLVNVVVRK